MTNKKTRRVVNGQLNEKSIYGERIEDRTLSDLVSGIEPFLPYPSDLQKLVVYGSVVYTEDFPSRVEVRAKEFGEEYRNRNSHLAFVVDSSSLAEFIRKYSGLEKHIKFLQEKK